MFRSSGLNFTTYVNMNACKINNAIQFNISNPGLIGTAPFATVFKLHHTKIQKRINLGMNICMQIAALRQPKFYLQRQPVTLLWQCKPRQLSSG